jgi:hypothetical protein
MIVRYLTLVGLIGLAFYLRRHHLAQPHEAGRDTKIVLLNFLLGASVLLLIARVVVDVAQAGVAN